MVEKRSKYGLLGRLNFEDLYNGFLGLETRQQTMIVGAAVVVLILILVLPVSCASSRLAGLEGDYREGKKKMGELVDRFRIYQSAQAKLEQIKTQFEKAKGESLTTVLETLANEEGIGENLEKLRPINLETTDIYDETGVDATVGKISLEQTVAFIQRVETEVRLPMRIKKVQIKPSYQNRDLMTLTLQISTIKLKGESVE